MSEATAPLRFDDDAKFATWTICVRSPVRHQAHDAGEGHRVRQRRDRRHGNGRTTLPSALKQWSTRTITCTDNDQEAVGDRRCGRRLRATSTVQLNEAAHPHCFRHRHEAIM
ncbi:MAG: hypothetical protein ACLT98_04325 [Eggerthellaceae bacterium]